MSKSFISYNNIHKLCKKGASDIKQNGPVDLIIAIGGGGFIPARILRTFLNKIGKEVVRTQWLDFGNLSQHFDSLIGKNVLIVDEVDDTRTTLHYAVSELERDELEMQKK